MLVLEIAAGVVLAVVFLFFAVLAFTKWRDIRNQIKVGGVLRRLRSELPPEAFQEGYIAPETRQYLRHEPEGKQ